jgi:hypothetical protein
VSLYPSAEEWKVDFGWATLSQSQKWSLMVIIGVCRGEWWGAGRAEFPSRQAAVEAMSMAADLEITPRLLLRIA